MEQTLAEKRQTQDQLDTLADDFPISGDPSKYVTLPVQYEKIWKKYQSTLEWFWTPHDVYLSSDKGDTMEIFTDEQRAVLLRVLTFMYSSHSMIISKHLFMDFMSQVDIKEASYYFGSQAHAKRTHCIMYSLILDELTTGDKSQDKLKLIADMVSGEDVRRYLRWAIHNTTSDAKTFSERLLSLATIQGIIYPVPFVLFNWLDKRYPSKMAGLKNSNDLIWRDEKMNLSFSCMLFGYLDGDLTEEQAHLVVREAVDHAKCLFIQVIPLEKLGLESELLSQYIEHSADKVLSDIGFNKLYHKESPFDWADEPKIETYQPKTSMNIVVDMSSSFGEAEFSTDHEF